MRSEQNTTIHQFRSNVQWYLEGNTPGLELNSVNELYANLKALDVAIKPTSGDLSTRPAVDRFQEFCEKVSLKQLRSIEGLTEAVSVLNAVKIDVKDGTERANQLFRECVIQLIQIAESRQELAFRTSIFELAKNA